MTRKFFDLFFSSFLLFSKYNVKIMQSSLFRNIPRVPSVTFNYNTGSLSVLPYQDFLFFQLTKENLPRAKKKKETRRNYT